MEEEVPVTDVPMSAEEVAEHANDKVDALIQLLIKKKVISEEEFDTEYEDLYEDDDSDTE